jgi:hypothetical protein
VHAALTNAGYRPASSLKLAVVSSKTAPGYVPGFVVVPVHVHGQPNALEVLHMPTTDDPYRHALAYFRALTADTSLDGLSITFVAQPYPLVHIDS